MDLVNCKDTLYYITLPRQFLLFKKIYKILNKNGYFLFQYIQTELKERNKNLFNYDLLKITKKLNNYHERNNPIPFLKDDHVKKLIKSQNFKLVNSIFDISTHIKNYKIITINRYFLIKK